MGPMTGGSSENRLRAVQGYVSQVVGCPRRQVTAVDRFQEGNRHDVYKVSYLDGQGAVRHVVVRVSFTADQAERDQAEGEAAVLRMVGGKAGPLLYDFSLSGTWFGTPAMCMQFVPGSRPPLRSTSPAQLEQLGTVVAWAHGRPIDGSRSSGVSGSVSSYAKERLASVLSGLDWSRYPLPPPVRDRLDRAGEWVEESWEARRHTEAFESDERLVLLHGDIADGNVLWGTGPLLIDWEYTRIGDAADEIAYTFDQGGLGAEQRDAFWRGYWESAGRPSPPPYVVDRVAWWEAVTLLGSTLWWTERWVRCAEAETAGQVDLAAAKGVPYYRQHVLERLDRLEELAR